MNESSILSNLNACKGWIASQLAHDGDSLILFLTKIFDDYTNCIKIKFSGFLTFHDVGFIGMNLEYVDVSPLGFKSTSVARVKGENPDDYIQVVFITKEGNQKRELIVGCRGVEFDAKDDDMSIRR